MRAGTKCENERFELYSKRASKAALLALRAVLRCRATLVGATFAASLESELSDSALLGYLRRRPLCGLRRKSSESLAAKQKYHPTGWYFCFGGEREIRTLAPVSRPTPLAGEPLHLLGYFSV